MEGTSAAFNIITSAGSANSEQKRMQHEDHVMHGFGGDDSASACHDDANRKIQVRGRRESEENWEKMVTKNLSTTKENSLSPISCLQTEADGVCVCWF